MLRPKRIPTRQCLSCRTRRTKNELLRIVKPKNGEVAFDPTGKAEGRGAYLCAEEQCVLNAKKRNGLNRAFSCRVDGAVYEDILAAIRESIK